MKFFYRVTLETEMGHLDDAKTEWIDSTATEPGDSEQSVYFLGRRFDRGSMQQASREILAETEGRFKYVVTPNVHHVVNWLEDPVTMDPLYKRAWRVYCDSRVLSRLARLGGQALPVITGSDLTADLVNHAAAQGMTVAVVGPTAEAGARLQEKYPRLKVVLHTPPMGFIESEAEVQTCVDFVVRTRAPLVFLAVGRPQQEILASKIADHPEARGVGLCIGASIDFLTGEQQRAPLWMQKAGLEWLHRLASDPQRLARRYLVESPRIFYFLCLEWAQSRGWTRKRATGAADLASASGAKPGAAP